jgi:sulfatase modifying factor 1
MAGGARSARGAAFAACVIGAWPFVCGLCAACGKVGAKEHDVPDGAALVSVPSAESLGPGPGAPRPRMAWIPSGLLHAGSELDDVPRVADAELPGVDIPMNGFYIDVLPWPNESGAIPSSNVTRAEAAHLCQEKGKRLCTELEWERACKGPDNTRYEYGATYDPHACGSAVPEDTASLRPSAQRPSCRSAFGVKDMHGGAAEWTDSPWGRGATRDTAGATHEMGVTRGGSDVAGELMSRCAYARPTAPGDHAKSIGFRCCAGPRNDAEVTLEVKRGPAFERPAHPTAHSAPLDALGGVACGPPSSPAPCSIARAWTWRPAPNVELALAGGCVGRDPSARCAVAVSRMLGDRMQMLAQVDTGLAIPEVVLVESADRRVRVRGADVHGMFFRELVFNYGRVDVRPVR